MTREEVTKLMAILGVFYPVRNEIDARTQVNAWHAILQHYDYAIAERAVFRFASNDSRQYGTFPSIGSIVKAINDEISDATKPIYEIAKKIHYGRPHEELSEKAQAMIDEKTYNFWLNMDAEEYANVGYYALIERMARQNKRLTDGED